MSNPPRTAVRSTNSGTTTPTTTTTTQTITQINAGPSIPINTLRLRAEPEERPHIQWAEDVVDNEGMGKKRSKVCCIYNKPHEPGDSDSDSSDDDSSSDSDSEPDLSRARKAGSSGKGKGARRGRKHDQGRDDEGKSHGEDKGIDRKASPNAYERQPRQKSKKDG